MSIPQQVRQYRRKIIRSLGKKSIRGLNDFLGRQSLVGDPVVFEPEILPFTHKLEADWRAIRDESRAVLAHRDRLPPLAHISPDSRRIAPSEQWKIFIFYGYGHRSERNCNACPRTAAALDRIPGLFNAWFSILSPRASVPRHRGITKGLLRCHLGLIIPEQRDACFMQLGDRRLFWSEGRCQVFDDVRKHSVHNDTDEERVILLLDVHRPLRNTGALVSRALLKVMRKTAYVREAYRNQMEWEEEFYRSYRPLR